MNSSAASTLSSRLLEAARLYATRSALSFPEATVTYGQFGDRATAMAKSLAGLGVGPGHKVGVLGLNSIETATVIFAAQLVGAVAVPVNHRFKSYELGHIFSDAGMSVLLVEDRPSDPNQYGQLALDTERPETLRHIVQLGSSPVLPGLMSAAEVEEQGRAITDDTLTNLGQAVGSEDTAVLMYTSGTTGRPRGCLLSHRALLTSSSNLAARLRIVREDSLWDIMPIFHLGALQPILSCMGQGAEFVSMRHFEPSAALALIAQKKCTIALPAFETIWMPMISDPAATESLSSLRVVQNVAIPERLRQMQQTISWATQVSNYGMTELGGYATMHSLDDDLEMRTTTCGLPLEGVEIKVVDDDGNDVPHGALGELAVRGSQMFSGYHHADGAAGDDPFDAAGWFRTGDLGTMTEGGQVTFVSRRKDMLKVGGENVAAAEIESYLVRHPAVQIAVAVPVPDERYGEVPAAFIQLAEGAEATEEELVDYCRGSIASYKVPRYVRFVTEWPMSGTKIQRFVLREHIAAEVKAAGVTSAPKVVSR